MDGYTEKTKMWLDDRFKQVDVDGVYQAHQPIYGFRTGPVRPNIENYIRVYEILRTLARLDFNSFLDVGGAEGYTANLVREFFGAEVRSCDLSAEACARAREIFHINAVPVDAQDLPYEDGEFDVVLSSETLEHIPDYQSAARQLLRVASKAVIVTVPHESKEQVQANMHEPHAHLHSLDLESFDFLRGEVGSVEAIPIVNRRFTGRATMLVDPHKIEHGRHASFIYKGYNLAIPLLRKVVDKRVASWLIEFDHHVARRSTEYQAILFLLLKDKSALLNEDRVRVSAKKMLETTVPLYKLRDGISQPPITF